MVPWQMSGFRGFRSVRAVLFMFTASAVGALGPGFEVEDRTCMKVMKISSTSRRRGPAGQVGSTSNERRQRTPVLP